MSGEEEASELRRRLKEAHEQLDGIQADLRELLAVLGLGDHARPKSPREVFLECVLEVRRLVEINEAFARVNSENGDRINVLRNMLVAVRQRLHAATNDGDPTQGLYCSVCNNDEHDDPRHKPTCLAVLLVQSIDQVVPRG